MGRRRRTEAAAGPPALPPAAAAGTAVAEVRPPAALDRGQLADCLSQTSKIAAECNSILRDLLRGRSPQHQDLQRLASQVLMGQSLGLTDLQRKMESQQATLAELLKMLKPASAAALSSMGVGGALSAAALGHNAAGASEATAVLASYGAQQPSLSIVKGWDALNVLAAAPPRRRKGQKVDRRPESGGSGGGTKRERCVGVETYWRQLDPAQRRQLLRVPLSKMVEAVRAEQGEEGVRDLAEGLALLRQQGGRYAAYWRCPCCDTRLLSAEAFVQHLQLYHEELYHEEVQYNADGAAVQCTKCLKEVVGAHYQNEEAGFPTVVLCMNCCWEEQIIQACGAEDSSSAMQLRMPAPGQRLLPPLAGGGGGQEAGGGRWSWLGGAARSGGGVRGSGLASSGQGSSDDSDEDGAAPDGRRHRRRSGSSQARLQQLRLQQQMEEQVYSAGGLLAAVARRLDGLALEAAAGGSDGSRRRPFEETLLDLVGQAQRLLSVPAGPEDEGGLDEKGRLEMAARLAAPEQFPNQEEQLQGALCFLSSQELQCLLGYIITRHSAALGPRSGAGAAGSELLSSSSAAAAAASASSSGSGSSGSSSAGEEEATDDEAEGSITPDLASPSHANRLFMSVERADLPPEPSLASYDPGLASVFQFTAQGGSGSGSGSGGGEGSSSPGRALLRQQLQAAAQQQGSLMAELLCGQQLSGDEVLEPHPWWVDHLSHKSWHDFPADGSTEIYLLQWVYGNVAHAGTEEFVERQRLATGPRGCDASVMSCLAELAEVWRQLAAATTRKRHLQSLRDGVREEAAAVRSFEEAGAAALHSQAAEFFDEVGGSSSPRSSAAPSSKEDSGGSGSGNGGSGGGSIQWSQRALGKLQRFHQLKDESSIRYAQALIDREVAVLELAEEMDLHELQVASTEVASIEAALGDARRGVAEAEAERQCLAAEGPAAHRKKDLLDKVNKEAEHRQRLQELQQRVATGQERIFTEEGFLADARKRHDSLAADLAEVRGEQAAFLERRAALDRACHDVLTAQERDRDQQLTDAHVDQRIRAVWQVVTGVADAIRLLHDRYAPDAQSREAERHIRCTGLAQGVCDELDERASAWWSDLDKLRRRAVDLACSDASATVEAAALEVIRSQLEEAAVAAREAATLSLLRELEDEEAQRAKKASEGKKGKKKKKKGGKAAEEEEEEEAEEQRPAAAAAAASTAGQASAAAAGKPGRSGSGKRGSGGVKGGGDEGGGSESAAAKAAAQQLLDSLESLAPEVRAELEYEAALERRRQELEAERQRTEQEMLRMAQEASLRELQQQPAVGGKGSKAAGKAAGAGGGKAATPRSPKQASADAKSAPCTPSKAKAASAAAAAAAGGGGRVITVAVAAVRSKGGLNSQPASPPPPPPPAAAKSPAPPKPVAVVAAAPVQPAQPAKAAAGPTPTGSGSSAGSISAAAAAAQAGHLVEMRVISYYGDWRCFCGTANRLWDTCACGQIPPCRDWVRGRCTYKTRCRFAHPPFELPDSLPRPKSPIAKPSADAVVYGGKAAAKAAKAAGVQGVATPESPAVVAAPRVVAVKGGKAVQLVKPGGKAAADGKGAAAAAAAAAPAADAAPPPPLKPAPWANVKQGVVPPPVPLPPAEVPGVAAVAAAAAAAAAGGGDSSAGFSLFGGSSPLLLSSLGAASEPALPGLGAEAGIAVVPSAAVAEAVPSAAPVLPAFGVDGGSSGSSLFGGSIFGQPEQPSLLLQQRAAAPPSPPQLPALAGSLPQSPLLLSPQQSQLSAAVASPSAVPTPLAFLPPSGGLGDLQLGGLAGAAPSSSLDLPGLSAFQQHLHQPLPGFGSAGASASSGLDFGGTSLLGSFGGLAHGSSGSAFGGLGLGGGSMGGGGGGLEDWSDLQQQLPSDLGAMLGSDPLSPVRQPPQQQQQQQHSPHAAGIMADPSGFGQQGGEAAKMSQATTTDALLPCLPAFPSPPSTVVHEKGAGIMADPASFGHEGGEAAKEKGAGIMADPSGFGKKGGEAAKEKGAGIMADPSGYGKKGSEARSSD
ncbi:hypothetical protein C2E21_4574 [Chlorella sorokiniana]|uniref:C3H1-type domain-containing protein n=1 Tax=Chlorella sorokiniana TaxID=3076 RepID=A0A2P6TRJ6_CHLSO|nr:hypothetical protein C2E21_4574 [Chlorella sorokiniana]|eukprot:PRW56682.1 hypothetical protein C2E21_4574 [Chlorella sorokiniana]